MTPAKLASLSIIAFAFLFGLWCIVSPAYEWFRENIPIELTVITGFVIVLVCYKVYGKKV